MFTTSLINWKPNNSTQQQNKSYLSNSLKQLQLNNACTDINLA